MKTAVASADGVSISQHFGLSRCFIVFDVANRKVAGREVPDKACMARANGRCEGSEHHHDWPHSRADIVAAFNDCKVLLCGGMGWRADK